MFGMRATHKLESPARPIISARHGKPIADPGYITGCLVRREHDYYGAHRQVCGVRRLDVNQVKEAAAAIVPGAQEGYSLLLGVVILFVMNAMLIVPQAVRNRLAQRTASANLAVVQPAEREARPVPESEALRLSSPLQNPRTSPGLWAATDLWSMGGLQAEFVANVATLGGGPRSQALARSGLDDNMSRLRKCSVLGQGAFGNVYLAEHEEFGDKYALKVTKPNATDAALASAVLEMMVLLRIQRKSHINLVSALAIDDTQVQLPILLPAADTDFFHVTMKGGWPLGAQLTLLLDAAKGVSHLHEELGVVHMDLKFGNILVYNSPYPHAKVADFGHTREVGERCHGMLGTLGFVSLEVLTGSYVARPGLDVFSLATMLLMMCSKDGRNGCMFVHPLITTAEEKRMLADLLPNRPPGCDFMAQLMRRVFDDGTFAAKVLVPEMMDEVIRSPDVLCGHLRRFFTSAPSDTPDMASFMGVVQQLEADVRQP